MRDRRRLSADDPIFDYFEKAAPISELMPIEFTNGAVIDTLTASCQTCGNPARPDESRGEVHATGAETYDIFVVSLCRTCRCFNHNLFRLQPNGSSLSISDITSNSVDRFIRRPTINPT